MKRRNMRLSSGMIGAIWFSALSPG